MYLLFSMKASQQEEATTQPPSWKHFPEIISGSYNIKRDCGLRTTDYGVRTVYKKAGRPGIKHGLRQSAMI